MRTIFSLLLLLSLFAFEALGADVIASKTIQPVDFEFGGYRFGQSPAANMVCKSGFCKSQAPGGDGRISFPFSIYETPGAVSTLSGMIVVNPRYSFWDEKLYRIFFQVDCTPLETDACLEDIIKTLDRTYGLAPISSSRTEHFPTKTQSIMNDFVTDTGAYVRIRVGQKDDEWFMPSVDILDKDVGDHVGLTLNPNYKPKKLVLPGDTGTK